MRIQSPHDFPLFGRDSGLVATEGGHIDSQSPSSIGLVCTILSHSLDNILARPVLVWEDTYQNSNVMSVYVFGGGYPSDGKEREWAAGAPQCRPSPSHLPTPRPVALMWERNGDRLSLCHGPQSCQVYDCRLNLAGAVTRVIGNRNFRMNHPNTTSHLSHISYLDPTSMHRPLTTAQSTHLESGR